MIQHYNKQCNNIICLLKIGDSRYPMIEINELKKS